jgi:PBSX family phage portal protein
MSDEKVDYEASDREKVAKAKAEKKTVEVYMGSPVHRPALQLPSDFLMEPNEKDSFSKALVEGVSTQYLSSALRRKAYRRANKANEPDTKSIADEETGYTLLEVAIPKYNLDKLAELYEKSYANKAAINAKTANIIGFGYDLVIKPSVQFEIDSKPPAGRESSLKAANSARFDVQDWLDTNSKTIPFNEVLKRVWIDYESTGNGYIEIGRKVNGEIGYIGHIPATTMRVRKARDGFVQISGDQVQFFRNFGDRKTKDPVGNERRPNEVLHLKKYSPTSGYYGVPDIIPALTAVAGTRYAEDFNLEYFENKAVPRYVIVTKGPTLSFTSQQKISEFFATNLKGQNHRSIYIPLPPDSGDYSNDFKIEPVENTVQDSSFTNYISTNLAIVLMAHNTPHTKAMSSDADGTLAAAKDFDKTFKEQVCRPEQTLLNFLLNRIVGEYTDVFAIKLKEYSLTDEAEQAKIDDLNIKNDSTTPNEVRARKGLPAIADGDKTWTEKQKEVAEAGKTDPTAQSRAEDKAQSNSTRARDTRRTTEATDSRGQARNPKGDGRTTE